MGETSDNQELLLFRRGSIGDGVVTLPVIRALLAKWPGSRITLLTNEPVADTAAPMMQLLDGEAGIIDAISFPPGLALSQAPRLAADIRRRQFDRVCYLSEPSGLKSVLRDWLFFRLLCGLPVTGLPLGRDARHYRQIGERLWETETDRLLRCCGLSAAGPAVLSLSPAEIAAGTDLRTALDLPQRFIAFAPAAKTSDKDWGDGNWQAVLREVGNRHPDTGLMLVGAAGDDTRLRTIATAWPGRVASICGAGGPRLSAAAMQGAALFLGADSGPMHLAAAVGVRCVPVFSARARPGVWFPQGSGHDVHYPWGHEAGLPDRPGAWDGGQTINLLKPEDVTKSALLILQEAA
jgi:ADP-heptose:LPS heptosyltransferase